MNMQTWKYVKPLQDVNAVEKFETAHGVEFPKDLKEILVSYNGGRPPLKRYNVGNKTGKEFKTLLSFNESDAETIYKCYPLDSADGELLPFASDPSGDYFVVKSGKICLWDHERDQIVVLADSFSEFLDTLY